MNDPATPNSVTREIMHLVYTYADARVAERQTRTPHTRRKADELCAERFEAIERLVYRLAVAAKPAGTEG